MPYDPARHHRRSIRLQGYDYTRAGAYFVTLVTYTRICWLGKLDGDGILLSQAGQVAEGEWQRLEKRFPGVVVDEFVIMPNHIHGIIILPGVGVVGAEGTSPIVGAGGPSDNAGTGGPSGNAGVPDAGISGISGIVGARQEKDSKTEVPLFASPLRDSPPPPNSPPPNSPAPSSPMPRGPRSGELGTIVGAFKSTAARLINGINHTPGTPLWQRNYHEHIIRSEKDLEQTRIYIQNNPIRWSDDDDNLWQ